VLCLAGPDKDPCCAVLRSDLLSTEAGGDNAELVVPTSCGTLLCVTRRGVPGGGGDEMAVLTGTGEDSSSPAPPRKCTLSSSSVPSSHMSSPNGQPCEFSRLLKAGAWTNGERCLSSGS
jgi:hypothetical protein